jgi:hypothetical protein
VTPNVELGHFRLGKIRRTIEVDLNDPRTEIRAADICALIASCPLL